MHDQFPLGPVLLGLAYLIVVGLPGYLRLYEASDGNNFATIHGVWSTVLRVTTGNFALAGVLSQLLIFFGQLFLGIAVFPLVGLFFTLWLTRLRGISRRLKITLVLVNFPILAFLSWGMFWVITNPI